MRRYTSLAVLPALFMIFTEVRDGSGATAPVIIDMTHATIRPMTKGIQSYFPGGETQISTGRGSVVTVTTPFEDVMKHLTHGAGGNEDLRPAAEIPPAKP